MSDTQKKSLADHIEAGVRLATSTTFKKADIVKFIGDLQDAYQASDLSDLETQHLELNHKYDQLCEKHSQLDDVLSGANQAISETVEENNELRRKLVEFENKEIANHDVQVGPLSCLVGIDHMLDTFLKNSPVKPEMKPNGTMFLSSDANRYYTKDEASSLAFAILILFKMISL